MAAGARFWRRVAEFHHKGHEEHEGEALCQNSGKRVQESPRRTEGREGRRKGSRDQGTEGPKVKGIKGASEPGRLRPRQASMTV